MPLSDLQKVRITLHGGSTIEEFDDFEDVADVIDRLQNRGRPGWVAIGDTAVFTQVVAAVQLVD